MLRITATLKGLEEAKKTFSSDLIRKATRSALDKSGTEGKRIIVNAISSQYNIAPKDIRKAIDLKRTSQTSNEVILFIHGKILSLLHYFAARQDRQGIYVNVSKSHTLHIRGAFIGQRGAGSFMAKRKGLKRYPLTGKVDRGPSIPGLVRAQGMADYVQNKMQAFLQSQFIEELNKRMRIKF